MFLQLGLPTLPSEAPDADALAVAAEGNEDGSAVSQTLRDLHTLLIETSIASGKLACGNCGHEYAVKEGIVSLKLLLIFGGRLRNGVLLTSLFLIWKANFLLPSHLV